MLDAAIALLQTLHAWDAIQLTIVIIIAVGVYERFVHRA